MKIACHLFVSGYVQGVFFRAETREIARGLGISGWVRNLKDGRVEIMAEGEEEDIKKLIEWVKIGPPRAKVSDLKVEYEDWTGRLGEFKISF